jgi:hypothetical protein
MVVAVNPYHYSLHAVTFDLSGVAAGAGLPSNATVPDPATHPPTHSRLQPLHS